MRFFSIFILFYSFVLYGQEFLYPVSSIYVNGRPKIYVIYQKSKSHIELWLWDPETKIADKGLLSMYIPASLNVLPSEKAFSFIDDGGRVRIKECNKRSVKSIDFCDPIYDISQIYWIDDENFYFSAKKNNKFCIFHSDKDGLIKPVLQDIDLKIDYMYPQKVGDFIFYIERIGKKAFGCDAILNKYEKDLDLEQNLYRISKTVYPEIAKDLSDLKSFLKNCNDNDFDLKSQKIQEFIDIDFQEISKNKTNFLIELQERPIAFLRMITGSFGFFISHPETICKHDKTINFDCFIIMSSFAEELFAMSCLGEKNFVPELDRNFESNNFWKIVKIFSFSIPTDLIFDRSDSCLYESILPLLPKFYKNKIYYTHYYTNYSNVDSGINSGASIFSYGLFSKEIKNELEGALFSPVFALNGIFFGGAIGYTEDCQVKMWINENGQVCINLPNISI